MTAEQLTFARAITGRVWQKWGRAFNWDSDVFEDLSGAVLLAGVEAARRIDQQISPGRSFFYLTCYGRGMNWCRGEFAYRRRTRQLSINAHDRPVLDERLDLARVQHMSGRGRRIAWWVVVWGFTTTEIEGVAPAEVELVVEALAG